MKTYLRYKEPKAARKYRAKFNQSFMPKGLLQICLKGSTLLILSLIGLGILKHHYTADYNDQIGRLINSILNSDFVAPNLFVLGSIIWIGCAAKLWGWKIPHYVTFTDKAIIYSNDLTPCYVYWDKHLTYEFVDMPRNRFYMLFLCRHDGAMACVGIPRKVKQEKIEKILSKYGCIPETGLSKVAA